MSAQQAGLSEAPTLGGGVKYYVVNHPMNLTRVIPHPGLPTTMQIAPPPPLYGKRSTFPYAYTSII